MHGRPARSKIIPSDMAGKKREREGEEAAADGGGERRRGYSRLDAETLSYYEEIGGRFAELDDDEEKALLADNALGECVERGAADVGTDAACSRVSAHAVGRCALAATRRRRCRRLPPATHRRLPPLPAAACRSPRNPTPPCMQVLEKLLPHAGTEALCAFTQACVEGDNLGTMCTR